jgi:hypothetical protein
MKLEFTNTACLPTASDTDVVIASGKALIDVLNMMEVERVHNANKIVNGNR